MSNLQAATQAYRINQVNSASPLGLLLMAYDAALIGCGQHDLERTSRALSVLRNALDFDLAPDFAMGMFRLYQYCGELARRREFEEAAGILRELRETWVQAKETLTGETTAATNGVQPSQHNPTPGPMVAAYVPVARGPSLMAVL